MFLPKTEKRIDCDCVTQFKVFCYFVTNVHVICSCAYQKQLPPLGQFEYLPFVTPFVLLSEDQETGNRIGLNSHHSPRRVDSKKAQVQTEK